MKVLKIELIVNAPSKDKKSLEKVENRYIQEYAELMGELLLNIKANPIKTKKIEYKVTIENQKQLEERIAKLEKKLTLKDDTKNNHWFFDSIVDGTRYRTMARYGKKSKDNAYEEINDKKQKLIDKLTKEDMKEELNDKITKEDMPDEDKMKAIRRWQNEKFKCLKCGRIYKNRYKIYHIKRCYE